jgi:hypothetical protein
MRHHNSGLHISALEGASVHAILRDDPGDVAPTLFGRADRETAQFSFSKNTNISFLKIKLRAILYDRLLTRTRHAHRLEETSPPGSVPAGRGTSAPASSVARDRGRGLWIRGAIGH